MSTDVRSLPLDQILRTRKRLKRELAAAPSLRPVRIAVLGGPTTAEVVELLEIALLVDGFAPVFYQSEYNKYFEDATLDVARVAEFKPDLVWIHTQVLNVSRFPQPGGSEEDLDALVAAELARFQGMWESIHAHVGCQILQNNFEHPPFPALGNLDATVAGGQTRFVYELNRAFARAAAADRRVIIHDLCGLAARVGQARWFDWERWFSYKMLTTPEAGWEIANSIASLVAAVRGRARKVLVLDLDNTLWGGIIGDDGVDKLQIGKETAVAEAYSAFQKWCLGMRERGVVLAVCSKNEDAIARTGFGHPDSILKIEHFSAFRANWEPKPDNIRAIAEELSLGLDSFVFVDDNPAERAIVRAQLPMVAVPEVGAEVAQFPSIIAAGRYFEMAGMSKEDLARADAYSANAARAAVQAKFADYGEYLDSLAMTAEIGPFKAVYLERITQLINKTNQFNLTTRRYTHAEIETIAVDPRFVTLYGRLADTFGDNGLISVIIGNVTGETLNIDLWIMSCRVLKRDMELAMLDALVAGARDAGATELRGTYLRTPKNAMVSGHYETLGFTPASPENDDNRSVWKLDVASYAPRNRHIKVNG